MAADLAWLRERGRSPSWSRRPWSQRPSRLGTATQTVRPGLSLLCTGQLSLFPHPLPSPAVPGKVGGQGVELEACPQTLTAEVLSGLSPDLLHWMCVKFADTSLHPRGPHLPPALCEWAGPTFPMAPHQSRTAGWVGADRLPGPGPVLSCWLSGAMIVPSEPKPVEIWEADVHPISVS